MLKQRKLFFFFTLVVLSLVMFIVLGCSRGDKPQISFSENSFAVKVGEVIVLIPEVKNSKDDLEFVFKSLNEGVASVDGDGKVLGVAIGEAKIRVNIKDREKVFKVITIVVSQPDVKMYDITFDNEGKRVTIKVEENKTVVKPNNPVKSGYEFAGWYLGVLKYNFDNPVTRNMTLVAKFEKEVLNYNVIFKDGDLENTVKVAQNTRVSEPAKPVKENFVFVGWYLNEEKYSFNTDVTADITLVAKYEETFAITYHLNGGSNDSNNLNYYHQSILPLNLLRAKRMGYVFIGWFDNPDFNGEKVTSIYPNSKEAKVLYAKFEEIVSSNITFNLNGGSFKKTNLSTLFLTDLYNFLKPSVDLNTFIHGVGNTTGFNGTWHEFDNVMRLHNGVDKGIITDSNMFINQSEYNKWIPFFDMLDEFTRIVNPDQTFWNLEWEGRYRIRQYIMHVRPNGVETAEDMDMFPVFTSPLMCAIDNTSEYTLPVPVKEGHSFQGWFDNAEFSGEVVTSLTAKVSLTKTLYAKWTPSN